MPAKPKVFFLQLPAWGREPNLAIAQLCAVVRREGYEAEVMDLNMELYRRFGVAQGQRDLWAAEIDNLWRQREFCSRVLEQNRPWIAAEFLDRICRAEQPVVCFPVTAPSLPASFLLTRWIKELRPDATTVFGGSYFTVCPESVGGGLWECGVDAVVAGDGEQTLLEILARRQEGRDWDGCRGLWFQSREKGIVFTGERPPVDLNALPFADFSGFDASLYPTKASSETERLGVVGTFDDLLLMASRGCFRKCSFCGHWLSGKGFRSMSGRRIYEEIVHQRTVRPEIRPGDSLIKFYDLIVNGDMRALNELCDLLIADPAPKLLWHECNAAIRPEMTYEVCRKLHAAGCRQLIIGLESGSQRMLDLMGKGQTIAQMKEVLRNASRAGLQVRGNFMFGHPGETEEDFQKTMDFLREMHPHIHFIYPSYTMTHLEGRLHSEPEKWGLEPGQDAHFWRSADGTNTYPIRLERYQRFVREAQALGTGLGHCLNMPVEDLVELKLGEYYQFTKEYDLALAHFKRHLAAGRGNAYVLSQVQALEQQIRAMPGGVPKGPGPE